VPEGLSRSSLQDSSRTKKKALQNRGPLAEMRLSQPVVRSRSGPEHRVVRWAGRDSNPHGVASSGLQVIRDAAIH
jgi:hypothetical protein